MLIGLLKTPVKKRNSAKKLKRLVPQKTRTLQIPRSFLRGNRKLKTGARLLISYKDYLMIQQFAFRELMEFRFAIFMLYHFGLRMSEIVCVTKLNIRELADTGTTVVVSDLTHTIRRLYVSPLALDELFRFKAEIRDISLNYRAQKTKYVMADYKGLPFLPIDISEVINEKLDDIINYMDLEEECCWSVESLRGGRSTLKNLSCNNDFFARYSYDNRWFCADEDPEFDLLLESNYTVTYYFSRVLDENPYQHPFGLSIDRSYFSKGVSDRHGVGSAGNGLEDVYLEELTLFTTSPDMAPKW